MISKSAHLNIVEANKSQLLLMRKILFASLIRNIKKEEEKGMYAASLAALLEFDRVTWHIISSDITFN